ATFGLVAMLAFLALITVPFVYEWRRGGLEWDRRWHPAGAPAGTGERTRRDTMGIEEAPSGFLLTTIEDLAGYLRKASLWPVTFGLACCAIEMMAAGASRFDLSRFGMEVFRASPRQADLM